MDYNMAVTTYPNTGCVIKKYREAVYSGQGGQGRFANDHSFKKQVVSTWENGRRKPSHDNIRRLAKAFKVNFDDLQREITEAVRKDEAERVNMRKKTLPPVASPKEFPLAYAGSRVEISIPTPGGAAAATDGQNTFFVDSEEDPLVIPKGVCCVRVYGDSMAPIALDRQRVFLRPAGPEPKKDDLVVVWTNEGVTFQSYFKRWLGWRRSETGGRELVL